MRLDLALLLTAASATAATLNVPSGYATVQLAMNAAAPGDTILLAAGVYAEDVETVNDGTALNRITVDGQGAATIKSIDINDDYYTFKNITFKGQNNAFQGTVEMALGSAFNIIQDCIIDSESKKDVGGIYWLGNPADHSIESSDNILERTEIRNVKNATMIALQGARNTVRYCNVHTGVAIDFIRLLGIENHIHDNTFADNTEEEGNSNHPDFCQVFGDNGERSQDHIIERNYVNNIAAGQVFQLSATGQLDIKDWIVRNNVFCNVALGGGGSVPGMTFENNVFYRIGSGLSFSWRTYASNTGLNASHPLYADTSVPADPDGPLVAEGDGGVYQYNGAYQVRATEFQPGDDLVVGKQYSVRTRGTGRIVYNGIQYANTQIFTVEEGVTEFSETGDDGSESNLAQLFAHGTLTYNGTTYTRDGWWVTDPAVRTYTTDWEEHFYARRVVLDIANNSSCTGNVFMECGDGGTNNAWYAFHLSAQNISANYNYVGGIGFAAKAQDSLQRSIGDPGGWDGFKWWEDNGFNGDDPQFADVSDPIGPDGEWQTEDDGFRLLPGSFLIGAGPGGTNIGAYEDEAPPAGVTDSINAGSTNAGTVTVQ